MTPKVSRAAERNPVLEALKNAPFDDEPITEEEERLVEEAREDVREGRVFSLDDVKRDLGLL